MNKEFRSTLSLSVAPVNPILDTSLLFDSTYREPAGSPIDEFQRRLHLINRTAPQPTSFDVLLGQLVLLGVVAAVESYFRALFRKLINIDPICQKSVHKKDVSYGAALHLSKDLLPEAILEKTSFISLDAIKDGMRELLSVKGDLPADVAGTIDDYVRICQLRHCAVHRFGKLGAGNAIHLGMASHHKLLEKPLSLDYASLQNAIAIASGLVRTVNNFLFNAIVSRISSESWTGNYRIDRPLFVKYYDIFADRVSSARSAAPKPLYVQFMRQRQDYLARQHRRGG